MSTFTAFSQLSEPEPLEDRPEPPPPDPAEVTHPLVQMPEAVRQALTAPRDIGQACAACGQPATRLTFVGVPLCDACFEDPDTRQRALSRPAAAAR
jgi:hypothetical protein